MTDASRTFGRPFAKEKEEGQDNIGSTDSGKIATSADEKPRPRAATALSKGDRDSRWDGGGEGEREDARPLSLAEDTGRGNRSQSFDSSPSSHDKSRKTISSERKRAASLNSHSPSDTSRPINFLISPEGSPSVTVTASDCNNMPPLPLTQQETIKDGSMDSLAVAVGNAGINTADYFMKAERYRQISVDSSSWSPNISSRAGSIDQESGKESQKSIESGVLTIHQDQELCASSAAGFTSEERERERERGARSISIGSYSRSPATRSPSPKGARWSTRPGQRSLALSRSR